MIRYKDLPLLSEVVSLVFSIFLFKIPIPFSKLLVISEFSEVLSPIKEVIYQVPQLTYYIWTYRI